MTDDEKQALAAAVTGKVKRLKPTTPVDELAKPVKTPVLMKTRDYATVHGDPVIKFTQNGHDFDQHEVYVPKA